MMISVLIQTVAATELGRGSGVKPSRRWSPNVRQELKNIGRMWEKRSEPPNGLPLAVIIEFKVLVDL